MNASPFQVITYIVTIIIASSLVLILFTPLVKAEADNETNLVPKWIKHVAPWWSQGGISDSNFINSMR